MSLPACGGGPPQSGSPQGAPPYIACQPDPDPSPVPPGPDQADVRFRTASGLRADIPYIDSVKTQSPDTLRYTWGVALTEAEESEIDFRDRSLGPALVSEQIRAYTDANAATYAGDYLDTAGGIATFLFTQQVDRHRTELSAIFPYPARLAVRAARYTSVQLQAFKERISGLPAGTFNSVAINVPSNTVRVNVPACAGPALAPFAMVPADAIYVYLGSRPTLNAGTEP